MDLGLFLLHAVPGLFFVGHGAQKLFGSFGGHGLGGTAGFFEQIGLKPGRTHAMAAGFNEFAGGVLLTLGLLLPLAALLIVATMVAAIVTVHWANGPWAADSGWELNAIYIVVPVALAAVGGGEWALDTQLFGGDLAGAGWALGALALGLIGGFGAVAAGRSGQKTGHEASPTAA
jgi:putative oxidoreductase